MALATLNYPVFVPSRSSPISWLPSGYPLWSTTDNFRLDATRTKIAAIVQVPVSGNITGIVFNLQAVTSDQQVRASIQTLSTAAEPSGTYYKSSNYGDDAISLAANTVQAITLGTQATAAVAGDTVAIVLEWAGTQGDIRLAGTYGPFDHRGSIVRYASSAWAAVTGISPAVGFVYGSTVYPAIGGTIQASSATYAYHNNTSGADEYGNKITVPFKCGVTGLWSDYALSTLGTDSLIVAALQNSSRTTLATSVCKYYELSNRTYPGSQRHMFTSPVTLSAGDTVYATFGSQSTSVTHTRYAATFDSSAYRQACCQGANALMVKRLDAISWSGGTPTVGNGTFTEVDTEVLPCGLIIDQLDDGASAGGGGAILLGSSGRFGVQES